MNRKNIKSKARTKTIIPTESYSIDVPVDVNEQVDEGVLSLWLTGDDTLLQFSSYKRDTHSQAPASHRLEARLSREQLADVRSEAMSIVDCPDVAAASGCDNEGIHWLYVYAAWPDLTILATISRTAVQNETSVPQWTLNTINSLRRST